MRRQVKVTSTVCAYELRLWINHVPVHSLKSIFTTLLMRLENASVPDRINIVPFISEQTLTLKIPLLVWAAVQHYKNLQYLLFVKAIFRNA